MSLEFVVAEGLSLRGLHPSIPARSSAMRLFQLATLALATLSAGSPVTVLQKRASQPTGLSSQTALSQGQVDGVEKLLNQSATKRCVLS